MKYILNFLSGIEFKNEVNCITLGAFSICNYQYLIEKFPEDYPKPNPLKGQKYFIYETSQENLNTEIFKEIFDEKIKLFFNTLLYCLEKRAYIIQDFDFFNTYSKNKNLYYTSEEFGLDMRGNSYKPICPTCRISNRLFKSTGNCIKLFEYIDQKPTSEIEQKIFLAVKWIGEGLTHSDLTIGYMCLCIALETLLSGQNSPLERGTAYQLREYAALLASKNKQERLKIYQAVKHLYNLRCSLSHAGIAKDLTEKEFYELLKILKKIINTLFILFSKQNIHKFKQLQDYIDNMKF